MLVMKIEWIEDLANEVYKSLGSGHSEAIYQKAMEVGIMDSGRKFESQRDVPVMFRGRFVGRGIIDIITGGLIVELKATGTPIGNPERQQLKNYMAVTQTQTGCIINFGQEPRAQGKQSALSIEYLQL